MQKLMSKLNGFLSGFTGWLMLAMMLMLVADFVARLFGLPLQDMAQMSVFVMMIVIYLGFSRGEEMHDHVALEFVTDKLPRGPRRRLLQIAQVLAVLTVAILLYAVAGNALMASLEETGFTEIERFRELAGKRFEVQQGEVRSTEGKVEGALVLKGRSS